VLGRRLVGFRENALTFDFRQWVVASSCKAGAIISEQKSES